MLKAHSPFSLLLKQDKDIGLLMLRLFLGLRLTWGGLRKFVQPVRLQEFSDLLESEDIPYSAVVSAIIFSIQFFAGISIMVGWKVKWAALCMCLISIVLIVLIPADSIFLSEMPPIATSILCVLFLFLSPGKYVLPYHRSQTRTHNF